MNFDELMTVWRSQDEAPLHDMNKTLLHLALRQDDAKLQKDRRREAWIIYVFSVGFVVGMGLFLVPMFLFGRATAFDFVVAIGGAAAAMLTMRAIYLNHRARSVREQSFGDSLRDQLKRRIAQLDDLATGGRRTTMLTLVLMGGICPVAILILGYRINQKSISDDGYMIVSMIVICIWAAASGIWQLRRDVEKDILPSKRRLEEVLREMEGA